MHKTLALAVFAVLAAAGASLSPAHAFKTCCDWGEPNGISLTGSITKVPAGKIEIFTIFPR